MPNTRNIVLKLEWHKAEDLNNGVWIWVKWWIFSLATELIHILLLYTKAGTITKILTNPKQPIKKYECQTKLIKDKLPIVYYTVVETKLPVICYICNIAGTKPVKSLHLDLYLDTLKLSNCGTSEW